MTELRLSPRVDFHDLHIPHSPEAWLAELDDLSVLHVGGADTSRLRIVSVLLHGNEPSSLRAMHRALRSGAKPATDVWVLVGAVRAALGPPAFGRRFLPSHGDLNRVWLPPHTGEHAERVQTLLDALRGSGAEALLDLHNNTGHNPPYGVGPDEGPLPRRIASLFGALFVHTPIRLGTLMEAIAPTLPSVAVECGRAGDPAADEVAARGLGEFLGLPSLDQLQGRENHVRVLGDPVRVTVSPGVSLGFDSRALPDAELTLDPRIDRHNFQLLPRGEILGWSARSQPPLHAVGADGRDRAAEMFEMRDGELRVATPFMPVMMTTSPSAALDDCLFYVVHPRSG